MFKYVRGLLSETDGQRFEKFAKVSLAQGGEYVEADEEYRELLLAIGMTFYLT